MNRKILTIFTPAFNRAYCIHQLYESLVRQTNKNFIWLIVDDGSSDNTSELIKEWQKENNGFFIEYIYKENGGMHTAHNVAYENINTELNICIDSDDYMPDDAVELIINKWNSIEDKIKIAGIVGLDADKQGNLIGKQPNIDRNSTGIYFCQIKKMIGDKKFVLRTDVVKYFPKYPIFEDEKFVPLGILYLMIGEKYNFVCLNKPLCIVDYLPDGSTSNIFKQYKKNARGFRYARTIQIIHSVSFRDKAIKILHQISSNLFIKDFNFLKYNNEKVLTTILIPVGFIFHLYIIYRIKKEIR